jgi:peptide/nickel transport system ATP-binding protein
VLGGLGRGERLKRARKMIRAVGLDPDPSFDLRPHAFSGGQCQRISIARALVLDPHLLICDEPVSSLDVSIQAQILNLLAEMRQRLGLTLLFISHDLAVVKNVCDRVAVMYLGRLCEIAATEDLFRSPRHPYTAALLAAIPALDRPPLPPAIGPVTGGFASPPKPPAGCRFYPRCPRAALRCQGESPPMRALGAGRRVACHFPLDAP